MIEQKYTLNEIAQIMEQNKWYLLQTEEALRRFLKNGYGTVTIKYDLRANDVEKVTVIGTEETILRPKEGHPVSRTIETLTIDIFSGKI